MTKTDREHRYLYCWFDTEYTTLEVDRAKLLQVALIVTDDELKPVPAPPKSFPSELLRPDGLSVFLRAPAREEVSDFVRENCQPLLERCEREGKPADEVDDLLADYMDAYPETRNENIQLRPVLAGNTIYPDYYLVRRFLPKFKARLNYRMFDVTTLKLEWQFHYGGAPFHKEDRADMLEQYYRGQGPIEGNKHDAYYDIQASMAELAYYRTKTEMRGRDHESN